jgi:hypothetical protein
MRSPSNPLNAPPRILGHAFHAAMDAAMDAARTIRSDRRTGSVMHSTLCYAEHNRRAVPVYMRFVAEDSSGIEPKESYHEANVCEPGSPAKSFSENSWQSHVAKLCEAPIPRNHSVRTCCKAMRLASVRPGIPRSLGWESVRAFSGARSDRDGDHD